MGEERRLIVFDMEYPTTFVPMLPKKRLGDFKSEKGIRLLAKLSDDRAFDVAWHEVGHSLIEHFSLDTISEQYKEIEEHVCRTLFERGIPNILANNPWLRSAEQFKRGLKR